MDLSVVESFHWVARLESIARAAKRMHVTPTAMSARMSGLERELGVQLLDCCSGRRVRMTIIGKRFLVHADKLLRVQQELKLELVSGARQPVSLRLGAIESVLHGSLVPWLAQLRREQPPLELELIVEKSDVLQELLRRGALDLVLAALPVMRDGVRTRPLPSLPLVVGSAALHTRARYTLAELSQQDFITFQRGSLPHVQLLALLRAAKITNARVHTSSSIDAMIKLIGSGFGVATLPKAALGKATGGVRLRLLRCDTPLAPLPIHASFRSDPSSDAIEAVLESAVRFLAGAARPVRARRAAKKLDT